MQYEKLIAQLGVICDFFHDIGLDCMGAIVRESAQALEKIDKKEEQIKNKVKP